MTLPGIETPETDDERAGTLTDAAAPVFEVRVMGDPVPWAAKQTSRRTGNRFLAPRQSEAIARTIAQIEQLGVGRLPVDVPLRIETRFYVTRPKGHYGTGRNAGLLKASAPRYPTGRPDYSNLVKLIEDCLTLSGVLADDDQIIGPTGDCGKFYCLPDQPPRTVVKLYVAD